MAEQRKQYPSSAYDYLLEEVIISADRLDQEFDVTSVISEISFFEDLQSPFITGEVLLGDFDRLLEKIDFQGTENIKITIRIPGVPDEKSTQSITRNFFIDSIQASGKSNDYAEVLLLSIVEDKGYKNFLQNVNKSYRKLSSYQIIEAIYDNYISFSDLDRQSKVQNLGKNDEYPPYTCIIPNWHPFDATKWIVNRMTHNNGYPHYFYSLSGHPDVFLNDLETMIETPAQNPEDTPYIFSQVSSNIIASNNVTQGSYVIEGYTTQNIEDNFAIIKEGYVGADYQRLDIGLDLPRNDYFSFGADDLFKGRTEWDPVDRSFVLDGKTQFEYKSRLASEIVATNTYGVNEPGYADVGELQQSVKRNAYSAWIPKVNIKLVIPGRNFWPQKTGDDIDEFTKIGDKIYVEILRNKPGSTKEDPEEVKDIKRSGNYIIYAIRHIFTANPQRHKVVLECFKLKTTDNTTRTRNQALEDAGFIIP